MFHSFFLNHFKLLVNFYLMKSIHVFCCCCLEKENANLIETSWKKIASFLPSFFFPSPFSCLSFITFQQEGGSFQETFLARMSCLLFYILAKKKCERNEKERRKEVLSMTKCCNVTQPNRCSNVLNVQKT